MKDISINKEKIELLAPAGDLEKLITAVDFGADAVYFGAESFSLRQGAGGFSLSEMEKGLDYAHTRGKKAYLTLNIYPHNEDIKPMEDFLKSLKGMPIDAFIVSDPGVIRLVRKIIPEAILHLSTQANTVNKLTAEFWHDLGIKRVITGRELSLGEIREIVDACNGEPEIETFVHGAMCMSYSGRCLLSNFLTGRDANRGNCAHPCRWKYAIQEEKRPGEFFPIEEDERGSYILNSKDLCMVDHMDDIIKSGISSAKIEGRMKSLYYVATVVSAYRRAIDRFYDGSYDDAEREYCLNQVKKASHRHFSTGFYYPDQNMDKQYRSSSSYIRNYSFVGIVRAYFPEKRAALVEQRNKMSIGETVEIFGPSADFISQKLYSMKDADTGEELDSAPHPQQMLIIGMDQPVQEGMILRKKLDL
jgi:putative protease